MVIGDPLRSLTRSANRRATSSRSGLTSWSIIVAPRIRRLLTASRTITGPKDIPPAPIRQMFGPCSLGHVAPRSLGLPDGTARGRRPAVRGLQVRAGG